MKSFLTYCLGPLIKAIAIIRLIIAKVKHIVNLAGETMIAGSVNRHIINIKAVIEKVTPARM